MQHWCAKNVVGIFPALVAANAVASPLSVGNDDPQIYWAAQALSVSAAEFLPISRSSSVRERGDTLAKAEAAAVHTSSVQFVVQSADETPIAQSQTVQKHREAYSPIPSYVADAMTFLQIIEHIEWRPVIWSDEGEMVFEWIRGPKHAVVSFEGDGSIAYTLLRDGRFVSGEMVDASASFLPADLQEYLRVA